VQALSTMLVSKALKSPWPANGNSIVTAQKKILRNIKWLIRKNILKQIVKSSIRNEEKNMTPMRGRHIMTERESKCLKKVN
jgi:hypothetical protein